MGRLKGVTVAPCEYRAKPLEQGEGVETIESGCQGEIPRRVSE